MSDGHRRKVKNAICGDYVYSCNYIVETSNPRRN